MRKVRMKLQKLIERAGGFLYHVAYSKVWSFLQNFWIKLTDLFKRLWRGLLNLNIGVSIMAGVIKFIRGIWAGIKLLGQWVCIIVIWIWRGILISFVFVKRVALAAWKILNKFCEKLFFFVALPFVVFYRILLALAGFTQKHSLEILTFLSWCFGWSLITWALVRIIKVNEIWLFSYGILLMGFAGWRFMFHILLNGFYFLSREEEEEEGKKAEKT